MSSTVTLSVTQQVDNFLANANLPPDYRAKDLAVSLISLGLAIACEEFTPTARLRACVVDVDGAIVIFYPGYPDLFAALQSLAHEAAHVILRHQLHEVDAVTGAHIYSSKDEEDAELFARTVIERRFFSGLKVAHDPKVPRSMQRYFAGME